jgi:Flp pilus assembly pilin Flp
MGGQPPPSAGAPATTFSPDGLWWWDGRQWRPAVSPDGRWRWDGRAWVPAEAGAGGGGRTGLAILIVVLAFGGVLFFVSLVTVLVLYTMGNQITNVFSNVAAALGSTPSP